MEPSPVTQTTRLIRAAIDGDVSAPEQLFPLVYDELHRLAQRMLGAERRDHTLQPTALIHEAWLRLADLGDDEVDGRDHFVRVAARAMRFVLVDHSRARTAAKRGGDRKKLTLDEQLIPGAAGPEDLIALDDALRRLTEVDPQLAQIVELRFFGGLSHPEVARNLKTSLRTIERGWRLARAWLLQAMGEPS